MIIDGNMNVSGDDKIWNKWLKIVLWIILQAKKQFSI